MVLSKCLDKCVIYVSVTGGKVGACVIENNLFSVELGELENKLHPFVV